LTPAKPTVDMEPPYENHPTGAKTPRIDSHQVRQAAYWNMLAGAAGHGYGALDLFWLYKDDEGREFTPPSRGDRDDWLLVLEDAAKGLPGATDAK
jgi:hypothetical protein